MEIKLSENSWHFKYYSRVVSETPPKSLCPYFWLMIIITLFSPIILIILSISDTYFVETEKRKEKEKERTDEELILIRARNEKKSLVWNKIHLYTGKIVVWVILPFLILMLLYLFYILIQKGGIWELIKMVLIIVGCFAFFIGVVFLLIKYTDGISKFLNYINPFKWKITIIFWEMIKGIYNKACPLITWETKSTINN